MRTTLATLAVLLGSGCSVISSSGLSNGGAPKRHDAGGGGTTTGGAAPGSPCASDAVCNSGVCGLAGSGNCCASACTSTDPTCAATGCDDAGACDYAAAGTGCGPSSCSDRVQSGVVCDGYGNCSAKSQAYCAYGLLCDDAGVACIPKCTSSADCLKGSRCNAGVCVMPEPVGPCTENDDCMSGYCGVAGSGHCCAGPCSTDAPCGATDCDPNSGVCAYPSDVLCAAATCDAGILQSIRLCDGLGACPLAQTVSCAPYGCGAGSTCGTSCSGDAECSGGYCNTANSTCCTLSSGTNLTVDSELGSDLTACCGSPGKGACQTLGHAMQLIDRARARDVIIDAVIPTTNVWAPPGEVYPVVLGWGAELLTSQTTFEDGDGGNRALFKIGAVSSNDQVGYASIVGASIGGNQPSDPSAILVEPGSTLYLASALVCSSAVSRSVAIEVSAGGSLVLGRDHSGGRLGTVTVSTTSSSVMGYDGIVCDSSTKAGCTVTDAWQDGGQSSLVMSAQTHRDIDAEDFASVSLIHNPQIGSNHPVGFGNCVSAQDGMASGEAILLHGKAQLAYDNGMVQCVSGNGFELQASASGVPSLTLNATVVQNTGIGVHAPAGSAAISRSTIQYNSTGVEQDSDGVNVGSIDLSGGDGGGMNTVACNGPPAGVIGVSVLNTTTKTLDASNVVWDTAGPDVFKCDSSLMSCSCQIGQCTLAAGASGMDAVYESTGTIVTTKNGLAPIACVN